jgi:hypothetical protein
MEKTALATDVLGATRMDTWHLPVKAEARAKAKAKARAKARAREAKEAGKPGHVKNLDALTHKSLADIANFARRVSKL